MKTPSPSFIRAVLQDVTWRGILTAWLLALGLATLRSAENWADLPSRFLWTSLVIAIVGSSCVLVAALAAEQAVRRGVSAWLAFSVALALATIIVPIGQWYIRAWLHLHTVVNQPGVPMAIQYTQMIFVAGDVLMFGGFAMLAYHNRCTAHSIMSRLRNNELKRVQLEQRLTESRLATARAQIDPQYLFEALADLKGRYTRGAPDANQKMDELIADLQATVTGGGKYTGPNRSAR